MVLKKKPRSRKRRYGSVPIVEIDGVRIVAKVGRKRVGLKRRPLPDGRYYVAYGGKDGKTKYKTFGTDPDWAVYRFVCWREGLPPRYKRYIRLPRKGVPVFMQCRVCYGTGECRECDGTGIDPE